MQAKLEPKLGDYFYLIRGGKKYLRKITYISEKIFEFGYGGWAHVGNIVSNTNKKSKVKYFFDEDRGCIKLGKGYVFISDVKNVIATTDSVFTDEQLYKVLEELPAKAESNPTVECYDLIRIILNDTERRIKEVIDGL